jgi:hypothetical protein
MTKNSESSKNSEATCAGKPIRAAMHRFSEDLIRGCTEFAEKARNAETNEDARCYNTACIFFAVSTIEAQLNEWISVAQACFEEEPKSFWHALAPLVKTLKLEEKWNLIASQESGVFWDKGSEPFQSFELIRSLRNELVHYKGAFLPKDVASTNKITGLMDALGVKSQASFVGDDCSAWAYDLLNCRELGYWVASKTKGFAS